MAGQRIVGDYALLEQVGEGSFAVVWKAKHTRTGVEVAIKEIPSDKLTRKFCEYLVSEINILKKTNHPNIIRLYDTMSASNRIFLVLEFCSGGDLGAHIQRHGRIPEVTARHFMRQLGAGLRELRANNVIHRDLKPQNLLLSTKDSNAVLKIADFGFARSLQRQGMAETLCGSPLYMAPEILQSKKYDAKADLWSVGAILYQLVTGHPPFMGQSPLQLLQHIQRSTELQFPKAALTELHPECVDLCRKLLRKEPLERISFEEFFNHKFVAEPIRHEPVCYNAEENLPSADETRFFQDEPMPFLLDEDPPFTSASPTYIANTTACQISPIKIFRASSKEKGSSQNFLERKGIFLREKDGNMCHSQTYNFMRNKAFVNESLATRAEGENSGIMMDSMEMLEKEYVLVSIPITSSDSFSESEQFAYLEGQQSPNPQKVADLNAALTKVGGSFKRSSYESITSAAVSQADCLARLRRLQRCGETIADLAHNKSMAGQILEAFSIQLVCLAVWKEALDFCSRRADGTSSMHTNSWIESCNLHLPFLDTPENDGGGAETLSSRLEQNFCSAVEQAEGLAPHVQALDGNTAIPDAMELIFQAALTTRTNAAVDELMGNPISAATAYNKAGTLLYFLLVEAVALPITPHLVLENSDKQLIRYYFDIIASRQSSCAPPKASLAQ